MGMWLRQHSNGPQSGDASEADPFPTADGGVFRGMLAWHQWFVWRGQPWGPTGLAGPSLRQDPAGQRWIGGRWTPPGLIPTRFRSGGSDVLEWPYTAGGGGLDPPPPSSSPSNH